MTLNNPVSRVYHENPYSSRVLSRVTTKQAFRTLLFVAIYLACLVAVVLASGSLGLLDAGSASFPIYLAGCATVAASLAVYIHLMRRYQLSFADLGFRKPRVRMFHLAWQIPVLISCAVGAQGIFMTLLGGLSLGSTSTGSQNSSLSGLASASPVMIVLGIGLTSVLTPVWEETLFRGGILSGLLTKFNPFWAIILSAVVFASVHSVPLVMPYLFVLGISLAWLFRFHQNLWASIILHATNNLIVVIAVLAAA